MKRRLGESTGSGDSFGPKMDPQGAAPSSSACSAASGLEMTDEMKNMVAMLVSKELLAGLLVRENGDRGGSRFGSVPFAAEEQQGVNAFLHQKLGKESLSRRPGPGGRKLTYIESCKAIELANRAFGFNGWSCHVLECKEEFREKRGDRWTLAFSSLVRIELKDGTKHEDVGFGSSDGQRDLAAALEQAKKASISDGRKRALRLFGEYLGNSCYDREHIKGVTSNRPMVPLASAPNFTLPPQPQPQPRPQQQQQQQQEQEQEQQAQTVGAVSTASLSVTTRPANNQEAPGNHVGVMPRQQPQQQHQHHQQQQQQPRQQPQQQQQQQQPRQQQQQQPRQQPQQQHWKPPQVPANPMATTSSRPASHQPSVAMPSGASAVASRISAMQTAKESKYQGMTSRVTLTNASAVATVNAQSHLQQQFQQQPHQPLRPYMANAPPPTRMMTINHTPPQSMKSESNGAASAAQSKASAQYDMEDISLSQFDYDPNAANPATITTKRMRM